MKRVAPPPPKKPNDGSKDIGQVPNSLILARKLDKSTTKEQIYSKCSQVSSPFSVRLVKSRKTNQSMGFAFIEYLDTRTAAQALSALSKIEIDSVKPTFSYAHTDSFVESFTGDEFISHFYHDLQDNLVYVYYWDDKLYASTYKPETEITESSQSNLPPKVESMVQKWQSAAQSTINTAEIQSVPDLDWVNAQWTDVFRFQCLLCQRQFESLAQFELHINQSKLHQYCIDRYIKCFGQLRKSYRNRAKEKRPFIQFEPSNDLLEPVIEPQSSIGSRLMEKMGWTKGQGLGSSKQGIKEPIQAVSYSKGAGLGSGSKKTCQEIARNNKFS